MDIKPTTKGRCHTAPYDDRPTDRPGRVGKRTKRHTEVCALARDGETMSELSREAIQDRQREWMQQRQAEVDRRQAQESVQRERPGEALGGSAEVLDKLTEQITARLQVQRTASHPDRLGYCGRSHPSR